MKCTSCFITMKPMCTKVNNKWINGSISSVSVGRLSDRRVHSYLKKGQACPRNKRGSSTKHKTICFVGFINVKYVHRHSKKC